MIKWVLCVPRKLPRGYNPPLPLPNILHYLTLASVLDKAKATKLLLRLYIAYNLASPMQIIYAINRFKKKEHFIITLSLAYGFQEILTLE